MIAIEDSRKMASQLKHSGKQQTTDGALNILEYLLFGYRRSAEAFHGALPMMVESIKVMLPIIDQNGISLNF